MPKLIYIPKAEDPDLNKAQVLSISAPAWMAEQMLSEANEKGVSLSQFIRDIYLEHYRSGEDIDNYIKAMTEENNG